MHGTVHSRPEFLYFWVYYVGFNAPWVVVPMGMFLLLVFLASQADFPQADSPLSR
ncbi:hypothetical protein SODALDRAFT_328313 [Sodiomyces alkalinus F11]|uniref:EXPERA domain-containing protein n=1 Tax=Sodiomyces alkalinus (strain CBS 110278 / VKM F-3762 / F11) TaxID=1314773 RepID=A0A3N2PN63_SODAK|nr:hypothetical protein SODALDRAFT_328313 [Sodiomyces alkalinus F11]ROT35929.1 hypothetical protein SODALDRAFT_328313 [Sodiomyces alkalinus F11]